MVSEENTRDIFFIKQSSGELLHSHRQSNIKANLKISRVSTLVSAKPLNLDFFVRASLSFSLFLQHKNSLLVVKIFRGNHEHKAYGRL